MHYTFCNVIAAFRYGGAVVEKHGKASPGSNARQQAARRAKLDKIASRFGYVTWARFGTGVLRGEVLISGGRNPRGAMLSRQEAIRAVLRCAGHRLSDLIDAGHPPRIVLRVGDNGGIQTRPGPGDPEIDFWGTERPSSIDSATRGGVADLLGAQSVKISAVWLETADLDDLASRYPEEFKAARSAAEYAAAYEWVEGEMYGVYIGKLLGGLF